MYIEVFISQKLQIRELKSSSLIVIYTDRYQFLCTSRIYRSTVNTSIIHREYQDITLNNTHTGRKNLLSLHVKPSLFYI